SRRRHTRFSRDWSSDVCSSDLEGKAVAVAGGGAEAALHREPGAGGLAAGMDRLHHVDGGGLDLAARPQRGVDGETVLLRPAVDRSEERRVGKGWGGRRARDREQ